MTDAQAATQAAQLEEQGRRLEALKAEAEGADGRWRALQTSSSTMETRSQESEAELQKANRIIERLTVSCPSQGHSH